MTAHRDTVPHLCYPLHVAGVLRATCTDHFWVPIVHAATPAKAVAR